MSEQIEQSQIEMAEIAQAEAEPQLADDGIGITLDEARALLALKHEQIIGKDDPVLMQVTLLNAFLNVIEKQHKRHESAMRALLNEETAKYQQMLTATFQPGQAGQKTIAAAVKVETAEPDSQVKTGFSRMLGWLGIIGLVFVIALGVFWMGLK